MPRCSPDELSGLCVQRVDAALPASSQPLRVPRGRGRGRSRRARPSPWPRRGNCPAPPTSRRGRRWRRSKAGSGRRRCRGTQETPPRPRLRSKCTSPRAAPRGTGLVLAPRGASCWCCRCTRGRGDRRRRIEGLAPPEAGERACAPAVGAGLGVECEDAAVVRADVDHAVGVGGRAVDLVAGVVQDQRTRPLRMSSAYTRWFHVPTYTSLPTTSGDDSTTPVLKRHFCRPRLRVPSRPRSPVETRGFPRAGCRVHHRLDDGVAHDRRARGDAASEVLPPRDRAGLRVDRRELAVLARRRRGCRPRTVETRCTRASHGPEASERWTVLKVGGEVAARGVVAVLRPGQLLHDPARPLFLPGARPANELEG